MASPFVLLLLGLGGSGSLFARPADASRVKVKFPKTDLVPAGSHEAKAQHQTQIRPSENLLHDHAKKTEKVSLSEVNSRVLAPPSSVDISSWTAKIPMGSNKLNLILMALSLPVLACMVWAALAATRNRKAAECFVAKYGEALSAKEPSCTAPENNDDCKETTPRVIRKQSLRVLGSLLSDSSAAKASKDESDSENEQAFAPEQVDKPALGAQRDAKEQMRAKMQERRSMIKADLGAERVQDGCQRGITPSTDDDANEPERTGNRLIDADKILSDESTSDEKSVIGL